MEEQKQEITNAVLAEKIAGLTKLTDERFLNLDKTLTRMEANSSGFALKSELEEVKKDFTKIVQNISNAFEQHNKDDKESFGGLDRKLDKNNRLIWMAVGGIAVISFVLQFLVPTLLKALHLG